MPKMIIDGKECEFQTGKTVIQVARENGISIPHFCWHPKLSVSGNCRICLVEIEKMPKLAISCATLAAEGMVVQTNSEKTIKARKSVMEFILINHPLDCPICDEAGECKLQDYAYKLSAGESRFNEVKVHKEKRVELGPNVMFDAERCISCSRCIRFCDEIAGKKQLTFVQRGDRVTIECFPGEKLDNPYSLNVTDICPVGALTNRDFRFKSRVWDMSATATVCQGCSKGCNIDVWVRNNEVLRLTPRQNNEVNQSWMCDNGRINTFKHINSDTRIEECEIKENQGFVKISREEGFKKIAAKLNKYKSSEVAFIASPYATIEDNFMLQRFVKDNFPGSQIEYFKHIKENDCDQILIKSDKTPNSKGLDLLGIKGVQFTGSSIITQIAEKRIKSLVVLDEDVISLDESSEKILSKLDLLIVLTSNRNKTTEKADVVFGTSTYAEKNGTLINSDGRIQRLKPAVATVEMDRSLDAMEQSRLDKFGTKFDKWASGKKYDVKPGWTILAGLSELAGMKYKFQMTEEVFNEASKHIQQLKGLDYDIIGEQGIVIK